jgi:hypothetical protein
MSHSKLSQNEPFENVMDREPSVLVTIIINLEFDNYSASLKFYDLVIIDII